MSMTDITALVADDFKRVDAFIHSGVHSHVPLVLDVAKHVVEAGGKRLRPLMCLLAAKACAPGQQLPSSAVELSAIVEMLHTATLVHDDVVDDSGLRRGVPTANVKWDNPTAVLVGDFLIARSFDMLVNIGSLPLLKLFSLATCGIAEGEVLQLQCQHNPHITEQTYFEMIHAKTSLLFEVACESAALVVNPSYQSALREFAEAFGNAFQMVDDVLDYVGDATALGKNIGDDLMEGKPTLPLIAAMQLLGTADKAFVARCITSGDSSQLEKMVALVRQSGALDYCLAKIDAESQRAVHALAVLPDSQYKQALLELVAIAAKRIG
jgi:octaprenyl-diphosphate synthase